MNTFLPFPSFAASAAALDYRRLGKQRVECKQILTVLETGPYQRAKPRKRGCVTVWESCPINAYNKGDYLFRLTPWYNHPAAKMWRNHKGLLATYGRFMCDEWIRRGYNDNLRPWFVKRHQYEDWDPDWLGDDDFHRSHKSNLIRKDSAYYTPKFPGVPDNLPYIWPV